MIKLAIAEDHKMFRDALVHSLNELGEFKVTIEANNGFELMDRLNQVSMPDLILIDVKMPIMDGPRTVKAVRKKFSNGPKILALSMFKENALVLEMIDNGANGYVTKSIGFEELVKAIDCVIKNDLYISPDISRMVKVDPKCIRQVLNFNEIQILKLICQEHTNAQISEKLSMPVSTVNTYRTRMLQKLNVRNSIGLVIYAIKCRIYWVDF